MKNWMMKSCHKNRLDLTTEASWVQTFRTHLRVCQDKPALGFKDGFYYNKSIKHYKGCIQVELNQETTTKTNLKEE